MCDRMEETKEESGVGSPMRAVHVDRSRPREEWGVEKRVDLEQKEEERGVGSERSVLI